MQKKKLPLQNNFKSKVNPVFEGQLIYFQNNLHLIHFRINSEYLKIIIFLSIYLKMFKIVFFLISTVKVTNSSRLRTMRVFRDRVGNNWNY